MRHAALEYSSAVSRLSLWQSFLPVQETELVVALDLFSKVGRHACKFAQSAAGQTGWRDHPGLLVLPAVGICDPSEALPPVCPVLVATGRKTIQPYCPESKYDLLSVQRVRCCNCCFSNLPPVLFFHIVLYPCRQLATQTVQLQSRICPPRSTNVVLRDFFSRFVLSFLTTPQSRPLGSEVSGAADIHYYLQSRKGYSGGNYSVFYYVAYPSVYCSSAVLSRLLDTIARISNDELI